MEDIVDNPRLTKRITTNKPKVNRPYDSFLRLVVEHPEVAKDIVCHRLPKSITQHFDFSQMHLCQGTLIGKDYARKETDILFKIKCQNEWAYLYFLIENQHTPDATMPLRLFEYLLKIMRRDAKTRKDGKFPLIIPLIIFDGPGKWSYSTDIRDIIAGPRDVIEWVWNEPFQLVQASDITDEEIREHQWSGIVSWVASQVNKRDIIDLLEKSAALHALEVLDALGKESREFVIEALNQLLYANNISETRWRAFVRQHFSPEVGEKVMTLAQHLHDKGWDQGMLKGKLEGIQEGEYKRAIATAKRLLRKGFSNEQVAELADLPLHEVELLEVK